MPGKWKVVGHRGYATRYPENTMPGFEAALQLGVDAVELDVHLTKDGVPVVFHDLDLQRTTTESGSLHDKTCTELVAISCHYPDRFGDKHFPLPITSLREVASRLAKLNAFVFIELKRKSIPLLGRELFLQRVLEASEPLDSKRALISFDWQLLQMAQQLCDLRVGWCLEDLSDSSLFVAERFSPDILICDMALSQGKTLWPGQWQWFIYGVSTASQASHCHAQGATWIEADDPGAVFPSLL